MCEVSGTHGLYAATSRIIMEHEMERDDAPFEPGRHLLEATDRLAWAMHACRYQGAVNAAEEAAKTAKTPEEAEEAAGAGARSYKTNIVQQFNKKIDSHLYQPVQVIGYIGLTRPA